MYVLFLDKHHIEFYPKFEIIGGDFVVDADGGERWYSYYFLLTRVISAVTLRNHLM